LLFLAFFFFSFILDWILNLFLKIALQPSTLTSSCTGELPFEDCTFEDFLRTWHHPSWYSISTVLLLQVRVLVAIEKGEKKLMEAIATIIM
jgi:hypothetical protein